MSVKECSWPGCAKKVEAWRWGCGPHWHVLPTSIRDRIEGGMPNALHEAQAWIRQAFSAEIKEKWDPGKWARLVRFVRERDELRKRGRGT